MGNELQQIYVNAGLSQFFFDKSVPQDLYRGQRHEDAEKGQPIIFPHPGFARKNGPARPPDVQIVERDGKKFVLGCRCVRGLYRGISTFDRTNPALKKFSLVQTHQGDCNSSWFGDNPRLKRSKQTQSLVGD